MLSQGRKKVLPCFILPKSHNFTSKFLANEDLSNDDQPLINFFLQAIIRLSMMNSNPGLLEEP